MNPVPHIAARKLTSEEDVENFLASLRDEAGVTRALVIGGETQAASFVYPSSVSLIETGLLEAGGIRSIGISGYPEPHPYISDHDLVAAMDKKIAYGQAKDLELFIVSQFCFDGNAVVSWLKKLRKRGVTLPVRVGITGPASPRTLLKYALKCGVGSSIRALSTRTKTLTRLLEDNVSESVLRTMAPGADKLGVSGIHLFPFGGLNKAIEWTRKIQTNGM